jgi:hypothetical protein
MPANAGPIPPSPWWQEAQLGASFLPCSNNFDPLPASPAGRSRNVKSGLSGEHATKPATSAASKNNVHVIN